MGVRVDNHRSCLLELENSGMQVMGKSALYWNGADGFNSDRLFANRVVKVETRLAPREVLGVLQGIESGFGRESSAPGQYSSRPIDLDLLLYDDISMNAPDLEIPHPRMHERGFVLIPLLELDDELRHPTLGKSFQELLQDLR